MRACHVARQRCTELDDRAMDRREQSYWTDRLVGAIVGGEARAGLAHEAAAPSSKTVGCLWVSPEGGTAAAGAPAT